MHELIPDIEEAIPLPISASDAMPNLTPQQELDMRVRTMKLLSDLSGEPLIPTEGEKIEAIELARRMTADPKFRPEFSKYPNETIAYLAGMVAQSNCMIVDELSDLKLYVVNKLVQEVEQAKDPKSRIMALSKLGEIDGVDAFKKRSEITHSIKPIHEVEKELLSILENVEYTVSPLKRLPDDPTTGSMAQNCLESDDKDDSDRLTA
jgi:hypothetical protein